VFDSKPWKAVKMPMHKWYKLYAQIDKDYPKTLILRERTKNVLGFTTREEYYRDRDGNNFEHRMCLDFFSEPKRTMFLLKYGDFLDRK
jgi:hypothetical protein